MPRISVLTLFKEQVEQGLSYSVVGKALKKGLLTLDCHDIRNFAVNKHGQVDDAVYGGGTGMLMMLEPIMKSWLDLYMPNPDAFLDDLAENMDLEKWREVRHFVSTDTVYLLSPKGKTFNQKQAMYMAQQEHLVFLCGHYEGIDQRVMDVLEPEEISLGDFILTGGEPAVIVMIDAIARLIPGVLPNASAYTEESFSQGFLEEKQYTRPAIWRGLDVPEVLLSGHQAKIDTFRKRSRILETLEKRPDLFENLELSQEDWLEFLEHMEG